MSTADPVRFGVIGLGYIAQSAILPAFAGTPNAHLSAIISGDARKLQVLGERYDVPHRIHYRDFDDFLTQGHIDALYIALPNHLHCEYTLSAAEAGVHVLCEKPLAVSEVECRKMIAACEEAEVHLMTAYRLHFDPAHLHALDMAQRGALGELRYLTGAFGQNVAPGNIRLSPLDEGGGSVYDMGIYGINAARYLFGAEPLEVMATSQRRPGDPRFDYCDESTSATLRFPGDRLASFVSSLGSASIGRLDLLGEDGALSLSPAFSSALPITLRVSTPEPFARTFPRHDQFGAQLLYFAECIQHQRPPEPDGYEGMADVRIIEAIYHAAELEESVALEPVEQRERPDVSQIIVRPGIDKPDEILTSKSSQP
ncbi:gfo/Idh/MocA family oxidoreductase [Lujinxingia litoralis]|uniref:Gfo/Idh/MocA family oxidoreductase n=1 Tax=Lujinxingia litoralis TaxID=2211119 RepID=A0A328CA44_9DELT|nr:Gfo/Idh/MocA family oxidoreductase [Lujinxingia litoralis]RAL23035.1 gfo/Idh/MocA family oxidoreductase [Lujinxingia litoralis]